jgi:hypothetical protein
VINADDARAYRVEILTVFGDFVRCAARPLPDFARLRDELQQHPDGYCYSRLRKLYRRWKKQQGVVLRQEHRAGSLVVL